MLFVMKVSGSVNSPRMSLSKVCQRSWKRCGNVVSNLQMTYIIPRRNTTVPVCEMKIPVLTLEKIVFIVLIRSEELCNYVIAFNYSLINHK